jgi:hypothetical protein
MLADLADLQEEGRGGCGHERIKVRFRGSKRMGTGSESLRCLSPFFSNPSVAVPKNSG